MCVGERECVACVGERECVACVGERECVCGCVVFSVCVCGRDMSDLRWSQW